MRCLIRFVRILPAALDLAWLRWARSELSATNPTHPDLPYIVRRIAYLEDKCRA